MVGRGRRPSIPLPLPLRRRMRTIGDLVGTSGLAIFLILAVVLINIGYFAIVAPAGPSGSSSSIIEPQTIDGPSDSGYAAEGGSSPVDGGEITPELMLIEATLTWTDDFGSNDEFRLEILVNGTQVDSSAGRSGTLSVQANVTGMEGQYSFEIKALDCPGTIGRLPIDRDNGNDWSLSTTLTINAAAVEG